MRNTPVFDAVDGPSHRARERVPAVPSGLIEQHDGVGVLREARGEAIDEYVHGVGIDLGEDEREGIVGGRPHDGIEVGGNEALVGEARRTLALGPPAVAIAPLLADPRLVHEPEPGYRFQAAGSSPRRSPQRSIFNRYAPPVRPIADTVG